MSAPCRSVLVLGGGAGGLLTALVLARHGCEVVVLERNAAPPPLSDEDAWSSWSRQGVPQFRQPHGIPTRALQVIEDVAPATARQLREVAVMHRPAGRAPEPERLTDDDRAFAVALVRRTTLERLLALEVESVPEIDVRRGTAAAGLILQADRNGRPVVRGLRTETGQELHADLVVDCAGRRSPVASWLTDIGVELEASAEADGFSYSSQWFRRDELPPSAEAGVVGAIGPGLMALLFPADAGTFAIAMVGSVRDPVFRRVQRPAPFMRLARRLPMIEEWLSPGDVTPISDTVPMGSIQNRHLRLRTKSTAGAIGIVNSGDSFASTNPSLGRGLGIAADMAVRLGDLVGSGCGRDLVADEFDAIQQAFHRPWLDDSIASDANTRTAIDDLLTGETTERPHPWRTSLMAAAMVDMECWRAFTQVNQTVAPPTRWTDDDALLERAAGLASDLGPPPPPTMSREELEAIVA